MGFGSGGEPFDWGDAWDGAINGLVTGATSVGLQWAAEALEISPLLGAISSNVLFGAIEGLLEDGNPIRGIFDSAFKAGIGFLTLGGPGVTSWQQACYISQVLDFSRILSEEGIVKAMEVYAAGFFHQETLASIWKLGGIYDMLMNPNQVEITENAEGETVKRIYLDEIASDADKDTSNYIDLSLDGDRLIGRREGNVTEHCEYEPQPDGTRKLKNGTKEYDLGNGKKRIDKIEDFETVEITYYDETGKETFTLKPNREIPLESRYDANGRPLEFELEVGDDKYTYSFEADSGIEVHKKGEEDGEPLLSFDYSDEQIYNSITDDAVTGFLLDLANSLAEEWNPYYALYNKVADFYSYFAGKYNEFRARDEQTAIDNFSTSHNEIATIRDSELQIVDNLYISGEITSEERDFREAQIYEQYYDCYTIIEDIYNDVMENIRRMYALELPQLPTIGGTDE